MRAIDAHELLAVIGNQDFSYMACDDVLKKVTELIKAAPTVITDEDDEKPRKYIVTKLSGTVEVLLLKNKGETTWTFVNLTKGHICECRFDSVHDAVKDLNDRLRSGKITGYARID